MAQTVKHLSTVQETWVRSLGWEDPLEKEMAIHPVPLPGKSHGQRSLVGYSPWGCKEWQRLGDFTYFNLGSSSFSVISFYLFIRFMGFSRPEYWSGLPFPSPVDHILSELSSITCPSWVALHGMAHHFTELDKAVVHVIRLVSFLWLWFSVCLPSDGEDKRLKYRTVKDEFLRSIYVSNMICNWRSVEK